MGIMLHEKSYFDRNKIFRVVALVISLFSWLLWWNGMCKGFLPFDKWLEPWWGEGFNPASMNFMVFAIITLFFCYTFFSILDEMKDIRLIKWCIIVLTWLGRNTLYIFFYHLLVMDIERSICLRIGIGLMGIISRIIFLLGMLIIPVIAKEIIIRVGRRLILNIYNG